MLPSCTRGKSVARLWNKVRPKYLWQVIWRQTDKWKSFCIFIIIIIIITTHDTMMIIIIIYFYCHRKVGSYPWPLKNSASWNKTFVHFAPTSPTNHSNLTVGIQNEDHLGICWFHVTYFSFAGQSFFFRQSKKMQLVVLEKLLNLEEKLLLLRASISSDEPVGRLLCSTFSQALTNEFEEKEKSWDRYQRRREMDSRREKKQFLETGKPPSDFPVANPSRLVHLIQPVITFQSWNSGHQSGDQGPSLSQSCWFLLLTSFTIFGT